MAGRIERGFRLTKASWAIVRGDPALIWLPVISMLCSFVVMVVFALGIVGVGLPKDGESANPLIWVLSFLMYVALSFVTIYFNAAVIAVAMKRLNGEEATLSDGLAVARQHAGKIFVWAVITATVGMVIRTIQERSGLIGRIILGLIGFVWSVITFFVVPVLIFEDLGVVPSIKRSASIFRERWGEQFTGNFTIGIVIFVVMLPVIIIGGLLAAAVPIVGIPLLLIAICAVAAVGSAVTGVFNAALYRFATTGQAGLGFTDDDLYASFRPRRGQAGSLGGGGTPPFAPESQAGWASIEQPPPPGWAPPDQASPPSRPDLD
jgi:hypothetical protein